MMDEQVTVTSHEATAPLPLYRAWLCGSFRLERRAGHEYVELSTSEWGGHSAPRTVLKALLCSPRRRASRGTLLAQLWPDAHGEQAARDLNGALSRLRKILRASEPVPAQTSCLLLTEGDSLGFALAGQSLIWLDADAALARLAEAERIGLRTTAAVAILEDAWHLFQRGAFLEFDEGEWCDQYRALVERRRYCCRLWLAEAYAQQGRLAAAETMYTDLLRDDPTDEDVVGRLMSLLHQHGLTHQALVLYQQTRELFEREGIKLSKTTNLLAAHLPQERRIPPANVAIPDERSTILSSPFSSNFPFSEDIMDVYLSARSPDTNPSRRDIIHQSLKLAGTSIILSPGDALHLETFEKLVWVLDKPSRLENSSLTYLDQRTMYYWRDRDESTLTPRDLLIHIEEHMRILIRLLDEPLSPSARLSLCSTTSKTALLYGVLLYDLGHFEQARNIQDIAMRAASEGGNYALQAVCGGWKCFTWMNTHDYMQALSCIQEARQRSAHTSDLMVQAWLSAIEAEVQAHLADRHACLTSLQQAEKSLGASFSENTYALFRLNPAQFLGYKGVCLQQFYQKDDPTTHRLLQEAREALEQAIRETGIHRRKWTYLSDLAALYARQGEIELAYTYATHCLLSMSRVDSHMSRQRLLQIRSFLQPYEYHSLVQDFNEQIRPLFSTEEGKKQHDA